MNRGMWSDCTSRLLDEVEVGRGCLVGGLLVVRHGWMLFFEYCAVACECIHEVFLLSSPWSCSVDVDGEM